MSNKSLLQRALIERANGAYSKDGVSMDPKDDQWSPAALERAGSTLKALNRMAKRPPVHVTFEDVAYTVNPGKDEREVLHNISGEFRSGELACILGPSGAGKSTLLNILSGYKCNNVTGRITVNGIDRDMNIFKKLSTYIMQDDLLQPWLTVKESMKIVANLKLGSDLSEAEKKLIIEEILQTLGLWEHRDTYTQKLSGGQSKRTSVALELVNNPPIIFLDEPTTGLDVVAVRQLVVLLRLLSRQGRTIVCTIHQPSASLFSLFDRVYIISQGLCCYQGSAQLLVPFMEEAGHVCPTTHNPADFVLETLTLHDEATAQMSELCMNGKICRTQNIQLAKPKRLLHSDESVLRIFTKHIEKEQTENMDYATTFTTQCLILAKRFFLQTRRDILWIWINLIHHTLSGILLGSIFFQMGMNGSMPMTMTKFCLSVEVFLMYTYAMIPILLFPKEVRIIRREHCNRWYSLKAYYTARTCSTLPISLTFTMLFLVITYFMAGHPLELKRFILFSIIGFLMSLCSEGLGLLLGSTFRATNGAIIGPAIVSPLLIISCYGLGFGDKIEEVMRFLMKLSYVRFGFSGLNLALYSNRSPLNCDDDVCIYSDTRLFLRDVGVINDNYVVQCFGIIIYLVLFKVALYFMLKYRLSNEFRHKMMVVMKKILKAKPKHSV